MQDKKPPENKKEDVVEAIKAVVVDWLQKEKPHLILIDNLAKDVINGTLIIDLKIYKGQVQEVFVRQVGKRYTIPTKTKKIDTDTSTN